MQPGTISVHCLSLQTGVAGCVYGKLYASGNDERASSELRPSQLDQGSSIRAGFACCVVCFVNVPEPRAAPSSCEPSGESRVRVHIYVIDVFQHTLTDYRFAKVRVQTRCLVGFVLTVLSAVDAEEMVFRSGYRIGVCMALCI